MLDRLAIIIIGEQSSGKTQTLKAYSDYYHKEVGVFKKGWRYGLTPFKPKFWMIKVFTYILPSSPTETNTPLSTTLKPYTDDDWYPDLILMAEQVNGRQYSNTIHYLRLNSYQIVEFQISNKTDDGIWDKWQDGDIFRKDAKLLQRREEVGECVRKFIIKKSAL